MANWYTQYVQDGKFTKDDVRSALESGISKKKVAKFIRNNPGKLKKNNRVQEFLDNYVSKNKGSSPSIDRSPPTNAFYPDTPFELVDDETDFRTGGNTPGGSTPGGSTPGGSTPGGSTTPPSNTPGGFTPGTPVDLRDPFVPETPDGQFPGYEPTGTRPNETTVEDPTGDPGAGPTPGTGGDPLPTVGLDPDELRDLISEMLSPINQFMENMPTYESPDFDYDPNKLYDYTYTDEDGNQVTQAMTIDTIEHLQDLDLQRQKDIGAERRAIINSGIQDRFAASQDYGNLMSYSGVQYTADMESGIRKYEADTASGVSIYQANLSAAVASGVQELKNQGAIDLQDIVNSGLAAVENIRGGYTLSGIGLQTEASKTIANIQAEADKYRARRGLEGQIYGGLVAGFWS